MSVPESMTCTHCGGQVTVRAMTSDGSYASCPCGKTKISTHGEKPVGTRPPSERGER